MLEGVPGFLRGGGNHDSFVMMFRYIKDVLIEGVVELDGGKVTGVGENGIVPTEEDVVDDTKVFGGVFGGKSGKPYEGIVGLHG